MNSRSFSEEIASYMDKMLGDYARYLSQHPEKANEYTNNTDQQQPSTENRIEDNSSRNIQNSTQDNIDNNTQNTMPEDNTPRADTYMRNMVGTTADEVRENIETLIETRPAMSREVEQSVDMSTMKFIPAQSNAVEPKPDLTPEEYYEEYKAKNKFIGTMRIQTLRGRGTLPVAGATVIISKKFPSGEHVIARLVTDSSGQTDIIELPAPSIELSQTPEDKKPFATYQIFIQEKNYVDVINKEAPVFADTLSLQIVEMVTKSTAGNLGVIDVSCEKCETLYDNNARTQREN